MLALDRLGASTPTWAPLYELKARHGIQKSVATVCPPVEN